MDEVIWTTNSIVTRTLAETMGEIVNPPLYRDGDDAPGCGCYIEGAKIVGGYEDGLDVETAPVLRIQVSGIELTDRDAYSEQDETNIRLLWDVLQTHKIPETAGSPA